MKNLILSVALVALAAPAIAGDDELATCAQYGELAAVIMESRHAGVPQSALRDTSGGEPVIISLISMAYDRPAMRSDEGKQRSINDFRNLAEAACFSSRD